jgi:hypothetical protein
MARVPARSCVPVSETMGNGGLHPGDSGCCKPGYDRMSNVFCLSMLGLSCV